MRVVTQIENSFKQQYSRNRQKGGKAYGCSPVKVYRPAARGVLELAQVVRDPRYTLDEPGTQAALKAERKAKAD